MHFYSMIFWANAGIQDYIGRSTMDGADISYIITTRISIPRAITIDIPSEHHPDILHIS